MSTTEIDMGLNMDEGEGIRTAVDVMVLKKDSDVERVLLGLRRAKAGEGTWGFPGGHQKTGETILQTAERELEEELGSDIRVSISGTVVAVRENKIHPWYVPHVTVILSGEYIDGEPNAADDERADEWSWFPLDQLPQNLFSGIAETAENYRAGKVQVVTDWNEPQQQSE